MLSSGCRWSRRAARATQAKGEAEGLESDRPHDIDEAEANVANARVDVRRAQRRLDDTVLRAPVAGTVASVNGTVGEMLGFGGGNDSVGAGGVGRRCPIWILGWVRRIRRVRKRSAWWGFVHDVEGCEQFPDRGSLCGVGCGVGRPEPAGQREFRRRSRVDRGRPRCRRSHRRGRRSRM